MQQAFEAMDALERGAIANPDEKRMVGHYWLRAPELAPTPESPPRSATLWPTIKTFAADVHAGKVRTPAGAPVHPRAVASASAARRWGRSSSPTPSAIRPPTRCGPFHRQHRPDGIARVLARWPAGFGETLCLVTHKSGGTPEPRNGMLLVAEAYRAAGLTSPSTPWPSPCPARNWTSTPRREGWLARFPMFDWVGGRTSELSAVGLVPAALQGLDIDGLLAGAAACDEATRSHDLRSNPAALMALMWHHATGGKGQKDMVVLPYKDRLLLFSRYLQQLVMESLGKRLDLKGERVDQGIAVYGNKGSTDQHAYVQQLRDGVNNFFATFIRVLEVGRHRRTEVEPGVTAGDYLHGFLLGTRAALFDNDRESMTITVPRVDARTVGALIALFERAVGLLRAAWSASTPITSPGVEAGKKAAASVLALQGEGARGPFRDARRRRSRSPQRLGAPDSAETVYLLLEHLAANGRARSGGTDAPGQITFSRTITVVPRAERRQSGSARRTYFSKR